MAFLRSTFLLGLVYVAVTGNLAWNNLLAGALLAALLSLLLRPQGQALDLRRLPAALLALGRYLLLLVVDIVRSGFDVARIVLDPALPVKPGIIAIPSMTGSTLATALSAHALSVTPGELVIGIDADGVMYTHCLDATHAEDAIREAQALRVDLLEKIVS